MKPVYSVWEKLINVGAFESITPSEASFTIPVPFASCLLESYRLGYIAGDSAQMEMSVSVNGNIERVLYFENDKIEMNRELALTDRLVLKVQNFNKINPAAVVIALNFSKMEA